MIRVGYSVSSSISSCGSSSITSIRVSGSGSGSYIHKRVLYIHVVYYTFNESPN